MKHVENIMTKSRTIFAVGAIAGVLMWSPCIVALEDLSKVMNYSIEEEEISTFGPEFLEGHYDAWNYMISVDIPESRKFAVDFKALYGSDGAVVDPQESDYNMVYLRKPAVEDAGTFENSAVREALVGQTFDARQGLVDVMPNHHLAQTVRIGLIKPEGGFEILEETDGVVYPQAWNQFEPSSKGYASD